MREREIKHLMKEHTESTPYFPILLLNSKDALEVLDGLK